MTGKKRRERIQICEACEHYVASTKSCGTLGLSALDPDSPLCGCFMPAKTKLKTASCPLGKWDAVLKPKDVERIREFLHRDNRERSAAELTTLAQEFLGTNNRASSCAPCNVKLLKSLQNLVADADAETKSQ